jgi:hypothetical protein
MLFFAVRAAIHEANAARNWADFLVRSDQTGFVTSTTASAKTFGACCGRAWPAFGTRWWIRLSENLAAEAGRDDAVGLTVERDGGNRDDG